MRYLAFILSIFVLALSVWPCCDDEATTVSQEIHFDQVQEHVPCNADNNTHTCSPFFHCGTCQAFALTSPVYFIHSAVQSNKDVSYAELPISPILLFAGDIWQPPQLA